MRLVDRVNVVLSEQWDPIGLSDEGPEIAYTEYSSYAPKIAGMIDRGNDAKTVSEYLYQVRTEQMGLVPSRPFRSPKIEMKVARKLLALKELDQ